MKKIGIIGSGAAGLCALHRSLGTTNFTPILWEHSSKVGGTWAFNQNVGVDEHGYPIHSSMYSSLRTNLPKEVMAFPDFPFKKGGKSFIHHSEVLNYLNEYADNFDLRQWIKFEHHVSNIKRVVNSNDENIWEVSVKDLKTGDSIVTLCDAIFICSGHYSVPKIPHIPAIDSYSGTTSHSHEYRNSDFFRNKNVIVLGAAASGIDISLEIARVANHVYLSHNRPVPIPSTLPDNMAQVKGITEATKNGFILRDGSEVTADVIIFCTGYEYYFPFLSDSCGIKIENNQVKMLYKHLINTAQPSMAFIGVAAQILPFPLFDMQVQYFLNIILEKLQLPTKKEMDAEINHEIEENLLKKKKLTHFHVLGAKQWSYISELGTEIKTENYHLAGLQCLYDIVWDRRAFSLVYYKELDYELTFNLDGSYVLKEFRDGIRVNTVKEISILKVTQLSKLFIFNFRDTFKFIFNNVLLQIRSIYRRYH